MYGGFYYRTGDPFFPANYGATVNRNLEFQERIGKDPGFPTEEEYQRDGWAAGPMITPLEYFFGYHSVPEFIIISLRGYEHIFTRVLLAHDQRLLWLFLLGTGLLLASRRWIIPLVILWSLSPPYSFLAGTGAPQIFPGRYAHHALPYVTAAIAWSVVGPGSWLACKAWQRLRPGSALSIAPDVQGDRRWRSSAERRHLHCCREPRLENAVKMGAISAPRGARGWSSHCCAAISSGGTQPATALAPPLSLCRVDRRPDCCPHRRFRRLR